MINHTNIAFYLDEENGGQQQMHEKIDATAALPEQQSDSIDEKLVQENEPLLSPRESEIARLVAKGLPNKTIAAILEISPWTVATHLKRIFAKLGVRSRTAMVSVLANYH